jgi:hypothetical protein
MLLNSNKIPIRHWLRHAGYSPPVVEARYLLDALKNYGSDSGGKKES